MYIQGKLIAETPLYRGNARKTLFTRDGDGTERLVSLAGEISGTAQSLMDAFIGQSRDGKNTGLLNQLWQRLYGHPLPDGLITQVKCALSKTSYPRDHFFDLRMGLKLDEDRWAAEANANYKMETIFRHAVFDFSMAVNDALLQKEENRARLYYLLQELREGRFWFGAGKSKGLGQVRLEMDDPFPMPPPPQIRAGANHLVIGLTFDALNPVLVGWNWGKIEPGSPSFAAIEGRLLVGAMRDLPDPIRSRLELVLGGPLLNPDDWKKRFADYLPRTIAIWLRERSSGEVETWTLSRRALDRLSKGKYALSKKVLEAVAPLCDRPFASQKEAEEAMVAALGDKANMAGRIVKEMERQRQTRQALDQAAWQEVSAALGFAPETEAQVAARIGDEAALAQVLKDACRPLLPRLYLQVDQQIDLIQSDSWVDAEIANRTAHLRIKTLLLEGKLSEAQWNDRNRPPEGVNIMAWRTFLEEHRRVQYRHMTNPTNLRKSIANDRNFIAFLEGYRARVRQELAQPHNVDFRFGGPSNREVSRKYGKSYDTMFMRMLVWSPSAREEGSWEVYIPGSTIKGAFRKRASQVLKTLWGESERTQAVLDRLFGVQGKTGLIFFSDAYLRDPIDPERAWCSMDGVRMDPRTGRPVETAKHDYLFAYGRQLIFRLELNVRDITSADADALAVLFHLLDDFRQGDIPLGGDKSSGFGWVSAQVDRITWLTAAPDALTRTLFQDRALVKEGLWHRLTLQGEEAAAGLPRLTALKASREVKAPPKAQAGFISHRAFGGYCGTLFVEAEVLTPIHVRESGEPSHCVRIDGNPINGWDFFSMSPPQADRRPEEKLYALPSRSIRGMVRHIYTIASDAREPSLDLSRLNPADALFGWVGEGQNQALMGRLSFAIAPFESPTLTWFKVPYPYTGWAYDGQWKHTPGQAVQQYQIAKTWRVFLHAPLAPIVKQLDGFQPDTPQASYCRVILPGAKARFTLRFWNLEREELERLIWCVNLEPGLAHKMGHHRHVGLGSLRLSVLPESFLIDWPQRYAGQEWRRPIDVSQWLNSKVIAHYAELKKVLDAHAI